MIKFEYELDLTNFTRIIFNVTPCFTSNKFGMFKLLSVLGAKTPLFLLTVLN